MIHRFIPLTLSALLLSACHPSGNDQTSSTSEINDSNTPLHLLQPDYDTPYGVPAEADVKATMDRVLTYLEGAMPTAVTAEGKLEQGKFRLTTYECGVTYAAMLAAARTTADNRYLAFTADRLGLVARQAEAVKEKIATDPSFDPQMRRVVAPNALDDAGAMAAALIRLQLGENPNPANDPLIERYVDFVFNKQMRLADGTFARNRPHLNTVWLDDMYMGVPCLAWYGRYRNDARYTNEAIRQLRLFKEHMWVSDKQLFRHGWVESMDPHPAFHWGRANGWAILTMCEVLDAIPADHPERAFVLDLLRQHIEGLCRLQDKTGLWHQLLDRNDTYLESSCTAIYAYCMAHAICEGWIDPVAYGAQVLLAWNAVSSCINEQGQVTETCVGTGMGFDAAFYAYRPVHVMAAHGYGPAIWAGAEVIRMLRTTHPKLNDSAIHFYPRQQNTTEPIFSEDETQKELF